MSKINVVWICHFSNQTIREHLKFCKWSALAIVKRLINRWLFYDFASWNTNAIKQFEKFEDVNLHIIAPHDGIRGVQNFNINGVHYCFFHNERDSLLDQFLSRLYRRRKIGYDKNTKIINREIKRIRPDIIHLIGAENPYYSEAVLSLPQNTPLIVSLQTLMCDPDFLQNYPIDIKDYNERLQIELQVLERADYIATPIKHFRSIIKHKIRNVKFLDMELALGDEIKLSNLCEKQYDFVYFAANISKAVDYAIQAYAIAKKTYNDITLHIIGDYDESLMRTINNQLMRLDITEGIDFTGKLPTHNDVINEIRKARFALLPLKIDMISGTIRESMANGLPVISTITPLTPALNRNRESLLLSEKGDFESMAKNMCRLIEDNALTETLICNGMLTVTELYNNQSAMETWRDNYKLITNK